MKITGLLFMALACAAFMQATSYAASPQHASDKNHSRGRAGLTVENRLKKPKVSRKPSLPRNAAGLRRPTFARSGAAKGGLIQSETTEHGLSVRPTNVRSISVRPSVASLNSSLNPLPSNVRHRGPNPAVVSGSVNSWSANSRNSNTGAINGTGMHRRP
jgi:hypothetical protein